MILERDEGGRPELSLNIPGLDRTQLDLGRKGSDLLITAGGFLRILTLPDGLAGLSVAEARYEGGRLRIAFVTPA